jgi:hypothetical protein
MNTHLDDLVKYRKKKTRLFQWKVVEAYRSEHVHASELEERLGISGTELRRLNRWYYRCRILPANSKLKTSIQCRILTRNRLLEVDLIFNVRCAPLDGCEHTTEQFIAHPIQRH